MKKELRARFRKWMNENIALEYSNTCGELIAKKIINEKLTRISHPKVSIFISKFPEISTLPLIEHLFGAKAEVYIPAWHSEEMWMCRVGDFKEFEEICEAAPVNKIPMPTITRVPIESVIYDFIIIPGLAFDQNCHRLGYGYGHYDFFLSRYFAAVPSARERTRLIGVGYDEQIYEALLPFEEHDIQLNEIVTPTKHITINPN